jgi:type IV secretory pathway VirB6-like protein
MMDILRDIGGFIAGSIVAIIIIAVNLLIAAVFVCFMIWLFTGHLPLFLR